jgi:hypothetical protein
LPVPLDSLHLIASTVDTFYIDVSAFGSPAPMRFYAVTSTSPPPPQLLANSQPSYTKDQAARPDPTEVYRMMPERHFPPKSTAVQGAATVAVSYPLKEQVTAQIDKARIAAQNPRPVIVIPVNNPEHASPNKSRMAAK